MVFRRGAAVSLVIGCILTAVAEPTRGEPGGGAADSARPMPHQDILELFGDDPPGAAPGASLGEASTRASAAPAGTSLASEVTLTPAGSAEDRFQESESRPIQRPDRTGWLGGHDAGSDRQAGLAHRGATGTGLWGSVRNWLPLLVVLGLIALAAWALRRFMPARRLLSGSGVLDVVARLPLSARQSLILVKMGRQLVLLGVTAERINALCLVDEPDQVAVLLGEIASGHDSSSAHAFSQAFAEESAVYSENEADLSATTDAGTEVRGLLDKIRRFKRRREVA